MAKSAWLVSSPRRIGDGFVRAVMARDNVDNKVAKATLSEALTFKALNLGEDSGISQDFNKTIKELYARIRVAVEKEGNPARKKLLLNSIAKAEKALLSNTAIPTAIQSTVYREMLVADGKIPASLDAETDAETDDTAEESSL